MKARWFSALLCAGLACAGLAAVLFAQQAPTVQEQEAASEENRIRLDVTRVNILFTVTDKKGRFITELTSDDFEIFEQKRKQNVLDFRAQSDLPLRLAILVDTSNSIRDRIRFQQEAAIEFLNNVMRPEKDRAILVSFDTTAQMVTDLENDMEKLTNGIRKLRPGGGTALYDAILYACRDKLQKDQPRFEFRRAMVVLSDGEDTQSRYTREQALEMAQKADVVIYTISTNISRVATDGDKVLRYFAEETGGVAFFPFKVQDLTQSFENIANELRNQYNIFYRPEPLKTDGSYQEITVRVRDKKNMVVRARKGYYAPRM